MKAEKHTIGVLALSAVLIAISTDSLAFAPWTSDTPWAIAESQFTTETDAVVFNVHSAETPVSPPQWVDPDGNEVDDAGTGHVWINHYENGFKVGHFCSMQIKDWNRAAGDWLVIGDGSIGAFTIHRSAILTVFPNSLWELEGVDAFASPGPDPVGLAGDGSRIWNVADQLYRLEGSGIVHLAGELPYLGAAALSYDGVHLWNLDKSQNQIYQWAVSDGLASNVIDSIASPAFIPADLAHDGSYLWATSAYTKTIYKLDAETGVTEQSFASPGSQPTGLTYDGTFLWNADADSDKIYQLDISEDILDAPASYPTDMASDGTYLWVADNSTKRIYKMNPNGSIVTSFLAPASGSGGVGGLTFDGTHLWHANWQQDTIYKMDPSGNVLDAFASPAGGPIGLAFDGTYLWCSDWSTRQIYRLNTAGTVISAFNTPGFSPRGLAYDGTHLWHADNGSKRIYQLTVAGAVVDSFPSPGTPGLKQPNGLAFDGIKLWHSDDGTDKLYELIVKAPVAASFDSPGTFPHGLAFDGTHLWHADMDEATIYKMDDSCTVLDAFPSPSDDPAGLTHTGGFLWNVDIYDGVIYQIDATGMVVGSMATPGTHPSGLAHDGIYWWNADAVDGLFYKLDIFDALITTPYEPPLDTPGANPSGLTSDGIHLWNTNTVGFGRAGNIFKISYTGAVIDEITVPGIYKPGAIGWDGEFLWFSDTAQQRIFKMGPTGNILDRIELPGFTPSDISISDDNLWAADESADMIYRFKKPGLVGVGASKNRLFTITSKGPIDLEIGAIGIFGIDAGEFHIENDTCSGRTLVRDQTCRFQVAFSPVTWGHKQARIDIPSNCIIKPTTVVGLSGIGVFVCLGDIEPVQGDGDVDGADLAAYLVDDRGITLAALAEEFGRADCP
jgi:DNA-binding beta-propeller fold protein YncE